MLDKIDKEKVNSILEKHYDSKKIQKFVDRILKRYKWVPQKDWDDFYSLANYYFLEAANEYNGIGSFDGFFKMVLRKKISSLVKGMQRQKRCDVKTVVDENGEIKKVYQSTLSLDVPIKINDNETITYSDVLRSGFDIWDEITEEADVSSDDKIERYLKRLSKKQQKIVLMLSDGYKPGEIQESLHIDEKEYADQMIGIKANENICYLF